MTDIEQRHGDRVPINRRFESLASFIDQYAYDLSRTGCFVRTDQPLAVGTMVRFKYTIVTDQIEQIEGTGEVMRVSKGPKGMGLRFATLTPESEAFIRRITDEA